MTLILKEVQTKKDIKTFVDLQFQIYKNDKTWIPPIKKDEIKSLIPGENPGFDFCDAKFWIAYKNNKPVGRIGGIINHKYNEKTGKKFARFSRIEFIDDAEVPGKLLHTAEKWAKHNGMEQIHGPLGFSNLDQQGMLIEGHEYLPSIGSVHHHPYYKKHMEQMGYEKEIDWVEFRLELADEIPAKAVKLAEVIKKRNKLNVIHFRKAKEIKAYGKQIFNVINESFSDLPYVTEFNEKMIDFYLHKYFSFLNPDFVKLVTTESGQLVGFIVAIPSLSEAMQKAHGKIFPFGFIHLIKAMKKAKVADLALTGIVPEMQGAGVPALLITELQKVMIEHGIKYVETTGIFETNHKAIKHWKNYEHIQHKRRRCFVKAIA